MFFTAVALSLIQAAAGQPAAPQNPQGWTVLDNDRGCAVNTAHNGGTRLSVFALPNREGIGFLMQNADWTTLDEGEVYPLTIRFDDGSDWRIPALARLQIDRHGPGLFFAIRPGSAEDGRDFMQQFASAAGMDVTNNGAQVERLRLTNSHAATRALAQCIGRLWSGQPANPFRDSDSAHTATRI
jgi:hypothetical protein